MTTWILCRKRKVTWDGKHLVIYTKLLNPLCQLDKGETRALYQRLASLYRD